MFFSSCDDAFHYEPEKIAYKNYRKNEDKYVSPDGLKSWLDKSPTVGPFQKFPYIVGHGLKIEKDKDKRERLANLYLNTYKKLISNEFGNKIDSTIYDDWEERRWNRMINVRKACIDVFEALPKVDLEESKEGIEFYRGQLELQNLVDQMDKLRSRGGSD